MRILLFLSTLFSVLQFHDAGIVAQNVIGRGVVPGCLNTVICVDNYDHFVHFDQTNSGLCYDGVKTVFSDSSGLVWIGTHNGLSCFDGTSIENFRKEDLRTDKDYINCIFEDSAGNLWIGTDGGIIMRSSRTGSFSPSSRRGDFPDERVFCIVGDNNSNVYAGVRNAGIYKKNIASGEWTELLGEPYIKSTRITALAGGKLVFSNFCDNLYLFDSGTVRPLCKNRFEGDEIGGIVPDKTDSNIVFVASKRHGLCRVNINDDFFFEAIFQFSGVPAALRQCGSNLLLSTSRGLYVIDGNNKISHITGKDAPRSLSSSAVSDACFDSKGGLWIATDKGVNYCSHVADRFRRFSKTVCGQSLKYSAVSSFAQDADGRIWVGTEHKGLFFMDPGSNAVNAFGTDALKHIYALCTANDKLWIGAFDGISSIDIDNFKVRHYGGLVKDPNGDNRIISLFFSQDGTLFVGTTAGLCRFDPLSETLVMVEPLRSIIVGDVQQIDDETLWMATYAHGVISYNTSDGSVDFLGWGEECSASLVSSLCIDAAGTVWAMGFTSGLFKSDGVTFERVNRAKSGFDSSEVFFTALQDSDGYLWIATDKGLVRYSEADGEVFRFTEQEGLINNKLRKASFVLADSTMLFGSDDGFIRLNPAEFKSYSPLTCPVVSEKRDKRGAVVLLLLALCFGVLSAYYAIHMRRKNVFAPIESASDLLPLDSYDEMFIIRFNNLIAENISNQDFSNRDVEQTLAMSHTVLNEKTKALLGTTPNSYIRHKRLEMAALMLRKGGVRVKEVCYAVGFSTPSYFSKCFQEEFGMRPNDYVSKYAASILPNDTQTE